MNSQTIQQAISFLTTPLARTTVPIASIDCLQSQLFAAIQARTIRDTSLVLHLSSSSPPPDFVALACERAAINWSEWIFLLGGGLGLDLDVYIHPGTVNVCFRKFGCPSSGIVTVWQDEEPKISTKELLAYDDDSDLFTLINEKVHSPSWVASWTTSNSAQGHHRPSALTAPVMVPKLQPAPVSVKASHHAFVPSHSRSSSYASSIHSNTSSSSSPPSLYGGSSNASNASGSPPSSTYSLSLSEDGDSWRRRDTIVPGPGQAAIMAARQAYAQKQQQQQMPTMMVDPSQQQGPVKASGSSNKHRRNRSTNQVIIDASKANVTAYDGGKTRVITGGVMLGSVTSTNKKRC